MTMKQQLEQVFDDNVTPFIDFETLKDLPEDPRSVKAIMDPMTAPATKKEVAAKIFRTGPSVVDLNYLDQIKQGEWLEGGAEWVDRQHRLWDICKGLDMKHPATFYYDTIGEHFDELLNCGKVHGQDIQTQISIPVGEPPSKSEEVRLKGKVTGDIIEVLSRQSGRTTYRVLEGLIDYTEGDYNEVVFDGSNKHVTNRLENEFDDLAKRAGIDIEARYRQGFNDEQRRGFSSELVIQSHVVS